MKSIIIFDRSSVELFAGGGSVSMTELFFLSEDINSMKIFVERGVVSLTSAEVFELFPI